MSAKTKTDAPIIFNLFPRHFKTIDQWNDAIPHIKEMGFNAVFVNPFHETGFSGSLYAVKNYYKLNPLFLKKSQDPFDFAPIRHFADLCKKNDLEFIIDLVINHTAFDSDLAKSNPQWYKYDKNGKLASPFAVDPSDPSNVTVWGDLATIDNKFSVDKKNLWAYWDNLIAFFQKMGVLGYRCDAAYQVPGELWEFLISSAKKREANTKFYAETLGCQISEIEALGNAGFDYLFNSSKWWDFDKPWALDQHALNKKIAPSIAFPESHDTERLASVPPATIQVQKFRYAFAALFSEGLLMPQDYEYGAVTRMDVVRGTPDDVDKHKWDLSPWIAKINRLKTTIKVLGEEGNWKTLNDFSRPFIFLEKSSDVGNKSVCVCINKNMTGETRVEKRDLPPQIRECAKAQQLIPDDLPKGNVLDGFILDPADIILYELV
ncbi:MAG: alpha-amylase family glycosyl hydrolase [Chitinispirillia bacterium]|nr:alpha-amylase family glycosyl hydrolase [Chitinispirillia bacterium]